MTCEEIDLCIWSSLFMQAKNYVKRIKPEVVVITDEDYQRAVMLYCNYINPNSYTCLN